MGPCIIQENEWHPIPLGKHLQFRKVFLSCWFGTGGSFTVFHKCFPTWKQVFLPIFSGFLCFSAVSTYFVWSGTKKNPQETLSGRVQQLLICHTQQQCDAQSWSCHCGVLGGSPTITAQQISAVMLQEGAGTVVKSPVERNGEGMQRSALSTVVGRACMACQQLNVEKSVD